jgi:hypothetical protein
VGQWAHHCIFYARNPRSGTTMSGVGPGVSRWEPEDVQRVQSELLAEILRQAVVLAVIPPQVMPSLFLVKMYAYERCA